MDFLKEIQKINAEAEFVEDSSLGNIREFIPTGSLSLNSVLSGDIFKGVPAGRVVGLMGKSGTGKSFITARIVREAQDMGYQVVWFESENATDKFFLQRLGVDTKKVVLLPVHTVEEFRNQCVKVIEMFTAEKEKNPAIKLMIVLDSLGNLPTEKEMKDALAGHNANDMGTRAKVIRSLGRVLTMPLAKAEIPMIVVNHTYINASGYVPIEVPAGGEGVIYISSILVLLTKQVVKEELADKTKSVTGNILKCRTTKNRVVPEGKIAEMKVDFETGVDKYHGLLDYAQAAGLIEKQGNTFFVKHLEKKFFEKYIYVPEVWEPILQDLNKYIIENCKFSSVSDNIASPPPPPPPPPIRVVKEGVEIKKPKGKKNE